MSREWIIDDNFLDEETKLSADGQGYLTELVRCKDCKHKEREQPGMVYCPMIVGSWVADDHFCKWGERSKQ